MTYSPLESQRFGLRIFRDPLVYSFDALAISQELKALQADVYIFRIPVEEQIRLHLLYGLGFEVLVADTLVYYTCDLSKSEIKPLKNDLRFEICEEKDFSLLNDLVGIIFKDYHNHYHANPRLKTDDILAGYQEWARNYVQQEGNEKITFLIKKEGKYIGFATCSFADTTSEGVLYGVISEAQGGGIYGDIVRFTQAYSKQKGYAKMKVSTQVHNYAVQKVWSREGFYLSNAYLTIHLNADNKTING